MLSPTIGWLVDTLWLTLFAGIFLIPLLEWAWHDRSRSPGPPWQWPRGFFQLTALSVVAQTIGLCVIAGEMSEIDAVTIGLSAGYVAGGTGIVLAHELGHRKHWFDRAIARLCLITVGYGHYLIEHNHGHHRYAATWQDPATARKNESLWRFFPRYFSGVWKQAWRLSSQRNHQPNEALVMLACWLLILLSVTLTLGSVAFFFLITQAIVAQLLVGSVDYFEHWGLQRQTVSSRHERLSHKHIWDCANPVSELLLFNLPRHSSHHLQPWLTANELKRESQSPQLPTGYAGMIVMAFVSPWFISVMSKRLSELRIKDEINPPIKSPFNPTFRSKFKSASNQKLARPSVLDGLFSFTILRKRHGGIAGQNARANDCLN